MHANTVKRHFYAYDKFMRIRQNGPLDKFMRFLFMCSSVLCMAQQKFMQYKFAKIISRIKMSLYGILHVGVPKANIENAIKSASSKGADTLSSSLVVYDAQGPSGYHMIIEAFTQNNQRTRPEIKKLLSSHS